MRDELPPSHASRSVVSGSKNNVSSYGVCQRANCPGRFNGFSILMYANLAEIVSEPRLHVGTRSRLQWLTGRVQYLAHDWRGSHSLSARARLLALKVFFLFTLCALALEFFFFLTLRAFPLHNWRSVQTRFCR